MRTSRRALWGLYFIAVALPATGLALMPPGGGRTTNPDTTALTSAEPLPDFCLAQNAQELVARCPAGVDPSQMGAMSGGVIPEAAASDLRMQPRNTPDAGEQGSRRPGIGERPDNPRGRDLQRRVEDLIKREVELTQRLLRTTPDSDASKPAIYFRIAQLFYEMQDNRNFAAGELDMQCLDMETRGETNGAQACVQQYDVLRQEALSWGDKAIEAYYTIVQNFPDWERIDEALFYLAFAFEERARDTEDSAEKEDFNFKARSVYNILIREHQGSRYIPNAYLSFAEYFFNEEGNMVEALEYYEKILRIPDAAVYGYSMYKKAWCLYNIQEYQQSLDTFISVIEYAGNNPDNADSEELMRTARVELPTAYAQVGRPDQAWRLFERVGGELTVKMMESLAEYYWSQGEHENAVTAYHVLMDKNSESDRLCDYQYWITQCRFAQSTTTGGASSQNAKQTVVAEIANMVEIWKIFVVRDAARHSPASVQTCSWWAADFVIDTAVRWHREASGTDQQPGTNDRETMNKAAELYKLFLDNFGDPASPHYYDRLEPPPEWEYTNPYSVYKARYFAAELLWKAEKWEECGQAFDDVVRSDPSGEYAREAAYASVLCYKKLYDQQYEAVQRVLRSDSGDRGRQARERGREGRDGATSWGNSIPAKREFTPQELAMEQAFHRYICYIDTGDDVANVKFNRAFLFLDANRWQEAAVLFKQIAEEYKAATDADDRRIAVLSQMNYFEIVVRLSRAGVTQCAPEIVRATTASLESRFPADTDAAVLENAAEKDSLALYLDAIPVLHCQQSLIQVKELVDQRKFETAAELALRIHDEYPSTYQNYRCLDAAQQDMMDDILNEAANYYEAANKIMKAIQIRNRLVQEHPGSDHVTNAHFAVAQAYARLAFFERAAQEYESFANNYATGAKADERAPEAMLNAVQIRIGLGQDVKAKEDADFLDAKFGSSRKYQRKAAEAYFSIGDLYTSQRSWGEVIRHYDEYLRKYGRKGGKEFEVRANMLVADAYWQQADCPRDEEDNTRAARCRNNKNKAYEYAQKANGLVSLPTFADEDVPEGTDPVALMGERRLATWNKLVEELDLELEGSDEEKRAQTFVRGDKVANSLGQARFYIGEKLYEQFLAITWPEFNPDDFEPSRSKVDQCQQTLGLTRPMCTSMEKYNMWNEKKFTPFVTNRNTKLQEARTYYDSIAFLAVPAWEIAASSRVGDMLLQFWTDLYKAPTPPIFQRPEFAEVDAAYREMLDNQAEPFKTMAIEAFGYCLITATREQWFNEYSGRCEEALFIIDPGRYRVSYEIYARSSLNRSNYAPPDLDLGIITTVTELGERVLPVEVVPGVPTVDDQGRYVFRPAPPPAAPAAPAEAPAAEPGAAAQ